MGSEIKWQLNVLMVDDSPEDIELFTRAFEMQGRTRSFFAVHDGEEAIAYLRCQPPYQNRMSYPSPNIIITDLKMPRMDGFQFLQWLHSHPECSVIPAIVFSGSALEADVRRAYQLGANAFINKPTSSAKLKEI